MFAFLFEIVYNETILHGSDMLYAESGNLFDYSTTYENVFIPSATPRQSGKFAVK